MMVPAVSCVHSISSRVSSTGVSNSIGVLHPFGIDRAVEYVEKNMQRFGFEVVSSCRVEGFVAPVHMC